jgi:hypothetical protein
MRTLSETDLLNLWEEGQARHPIDRALLLCAWARPDIAADRFACLPLGVVNAGLLKMRTALFGRRVELQVACEHCGEQLEIPLDLAELAADTGTGAGAGEQETGAEIEVEGFRFRLPASRDLAAITYDLDTEAAALRLLDACCVARPDGNTATADVLAQAEERLEAADPLADPRLDVACPACGQHMEAALDPGTLLWDDMQAYARSLLGQVHALARAYGWTEREVLSLSPRRRAAYLEMTGG